MKRGSVDATALFEFAPNADNPKFNNWYTEKPVSEWEGVVSSNSKDQILEVDFAKIDPLLQVRHRFPNLAVMRFPAFKSDKGGDRERAIATLTPAYVKQVSLKTNCRVYMHMYIHINKCTHTHKCVYIGVLLWSINIIFEILASLPHHFSHMVACERLRVPSLAF